MALSRDEQAFARRWLKKGIDKRKVVNAIGQRRKETGSFGDTAFGITSAIPTTVLGAAHYLGKGSQKLWGAIPGEFAQKQSDKVGEWVKKVDRHSGRIQLNVEKRGLDAELGQLPGNIAVDMGLTAGIGAITGGAGGAAVATSKVPKYSRYTKTLMELAKKSPRLAGWMKRMGIALPVGLSIGALQDKGQGYDVGRGMFMGTVGMSAFSLLGAKGIGRRLLTEGDDVGRIIARMSAKKASIDKTGDGLSSELSSAERRWGTFNQYQTGKEAAMKSSTKTDKMGAILDGENWEIQEVLAGRKPAYYDSSGFFSSINKNITNSLHVGKKDGKYVIANTKEGLERVMNAKDPRDLGLALGYKDLLPSGNRSVTQETGGRAAEREIEGSFRELIDKSSGRELSRVLANFMGQPLEKAAPSRGGDTDRFAKVLTGVEGWAHRMGELLNNAGLDKDAVKDIPQKMISTANKIKSSFSYRIGVIRGFDESMRLGKLESILNGAAPANKTEAEQAAFVRNLLDDILDKFNTTAGTNVSHNKNNFPVIITPLIREMLNNKGGKDALKKLKSDWMFKNSIESELPDGTSISWDGFYRYYKTQDWRVLSFMDGWEKTIPKSWQMRDVNWVLPSYLDDLARRAAFAKHLGTKGEFPAVALTKMIKGIPAEAEKIGKTNSFWRGVGNWLQNTGTTLEKAGPTGSFMRKAFKKVDTTAGDMNSSFFTRVDSLRNLGKKETQERLGRLLDGAEPVNKIEEEQVSSARELLTDILGEHNRISGTRVPDIPNYFPRELLPKISSALRGTRDLKKMKQEWLLANKALVKSVKGDEEALDMMWVKFRKSYMDKDFRASFQHKRRAEKIPDHWREWDAGKVIASYLAKASKRAAFIKHLGARGELPMLALSKIVKGAQQGLLPKANPAMIDKILKQYFERTPQPEWLKNVRAFEMLKMSLSAITQLADHVPTAMRHGMWNTFSTSMQAIASKSKREFADSSGAALDALSQSRLGADPADRFTSWWLEFIQFSRMQKWTDRTVVLSGLKYAEKTRNALLKHPNNFVLRQRLSKMVGEDYVYGYLKSGMTDRIRRRIGSRAMTDLRPISNMDVPFNFNEPGAKGLITLFRRYVVQITNTVNKETHLKWKSGDRQGAMNSMAALMIAGVFTGEIIIEGRRAAWDGIIGLMNYVVNGEWRTPNHQKRSEEFIGRVAENLAATGGIGMATEFFSIFASGDIGGTSRFARILGPAAADLEHIFLGLPKTIMSASGKVKSRKQTKSEATGKIIGDVLKPIPFARKIFNNVVRKVGLSSRDKKPSRSLIGDAVNKIKEVVIGATDAGIAGLMAGNEIGTTSKNVVLHGDGGAKLAEYINEGNGAWFNVAEVLDGDTIRFKDGSTLRFAGVNAPELKKEWLNKRSERGAEAAKDFTAKAFPIGSKAYVAEDKVSGGEDVFGRKLGYPFTEGGRDISKELIDSGNAKVFNKYPYDRKGEFNQKKKRSDIVVDFLSQSIAHQESGGDYNATGVKITKGTFKGERAYGKFQIMPSNVKAWSKKWLGKEKTTLTNQEQNLIATKQLNEYYQQGFAKSGNIKDAVRWAAVRWYGNNGKRLRTVADISKDSVVQGGKTFASPEQYANNIVSIMRTRLRAVNKN